MTLRFTVSIAGATALPPIDLAADVIEIGSAADAVVRLPAAHVDAHHVRIESGRRLIALAPATLGDRALDRGAIVDLALPARLTIGAVAIEIAASTDASPPIRTASLAREVIRAMVASASGAPELVVEAGPAVGARCALDPPPSRLVLGRGEDADWIVVDPDLSRAHVAIERSWDRITVLDLESKNGTRVSGATVPPAGAELVHDGVIEAGGTRIRFTDPAARYLAELSRPPTLVTAPAPATATATAPAPVTATATAPAPVTATATATATVSAAAPFWIAVGICILAVAGLVWVLA